MFIAPIHTGVSFVIDDLIGAISKTNDETFSTPLSVLSGATIGEHVRHSIEMYICLQNGYNFGSVNYEMRARNKSLQTSVSKAICELELIKSTLFLEDKPLLLLAAYDYNTDKQSAYSSTYFRELAYCLEHLIHHMALIRIGFMALDYIVLPETFGMAPSTHRVKRFHSS